MGTLAAKMTMDATVWFAQNRSDLAPLIALNLAGKLGEVAEIQRWSPPVADFDAKADKNGDDIAAFITNSDELFKSVTQATGYPEELASILSSVANFMGWKVSR